MEPVDLTTEAGQNVLILVIHEIAHRLSRRYRLQRADAEDAGQDVVLHCVMKLRVCEWNIGNRTLESHIGCLVRRRVALLKRQRRRWMERDLEYALDLESSVRRWMEPDTNFEAAELEQLHEETLRRLPPAARRAFELVRNEGMTWAAAAEQLGVTKNSVGANLLRAHKAFGTAMEKQGFVVRRRRRAVAASSGARAQA